MKRSTTLDAGATEAPPPGQKKRILLAVGGSGLAVASGSAVAAASWCVQGRGHPGRGDPGGGWAGGGHVWDGCGDGQGRLVDKEAVALALFPGWCRGDAGDAGAGTRDGQGESPAVVQPKVTAPPVFAAGANSRCRGVAPRANPIATEVPAADPVTPQPVNPQAATRPTTPGRWRGPSVARVGVPGPAVVRPATLANEGRCWRRFGHADDNGASTGLRLCDKHRRSFAQGGLVQEREALAVIALESWGKVRQAQRRASRFLATYPDSIHAARMRTVLERCSMNRP